MNKKEQIQELIFNLLDEVIQEERNKAQKELLEEILNKVNLTKGNWSDIIENKLVSLDTTKQSKENK